MQSISSPFIPFAPALPSGSTYDIFTNIDDQAVVLHKIQKMWGFDPQAITISGTVCEVAREDVIRIVLVDAKGRVCQEVEFDGSFNAHIRVEAREGDLRSLAKRDIIGEIQTAWLNANGYTAEYPCSTSAKVLANGGLEIELLPAL